MADRQLTHDEKRALVIDHFGPAMAALGDYLATGNVNVGDGKEVRGVIPAADGDIVVTLTLRLQRAE